jgi:3-oxoacyl-[acyl-carrier-protein] synthase-3
MASSTISGCKIVGISTCVPGQRFDNIKDTTEFTKEEVKKVVAMAGVNARRYADNNTTSSDLCIKAAKKLLESICWDASSIDVLIFITQSPDYFLPQTSSVIYKALQMNESCAAFDVGLGCSGYPYGLWLASMMIKTGGAKRVLVCHGETPTRFSDKSDRAVSLLFGDAGSATAIELDKSSDSFPWYFMQYTDGNRFQDMIIEGGGFRERFPEDDRKYYVRMNGANIFNFTIKRVPELINNTLEYADLSIEDIDYYIFHQSNSYIMKHVLKKVGLSKDKIPFIIGEYGNTGGPSVPLTMTLGNLTWSKNHSLKLMLLAYGVGLSWASALIGLESDVVLRHVELKK